MNSRKIKNQGITPPNSYLIHPATLLLVKQNNIKKNKNNTSQNLLITPSINFSTEDILLAYNITYITDLEKTIEDFPELTRIRLLKLLLSNNNLHNLSETKLPRIYNFLLNYYNLNKSNLNTKLSSLKNKSFEQVFKN